MGGPEPDKESKAERSNQSIPAERTGKNGLSGFFIVDTVSRVIKAVTVATVV